MRYVRVWEGPDSSMTVTEDSTPLLRRAFTRTAVPLEWHLNDSALIRSRPGGRDELWADTSAREPAGAWQRCGSPGPGAGAGSVPWTVARGPQLQKPFWESTGCGLGGPLRRGCPRA